MSERPLLMIPGPIELSPAVTEAYSVPAPGHLAPHVIEAFGQSIERMRKVWLAGDDAQPFIVSGSGTLAMEMAAANMVSRGDKGLVVNTGYFSDRMGIMLERYGVEVAFVGGEPGDVPSVDDVEKALKHHQPKALFMTHVDTSTGVRVDPQPMLDLAKANDVLTFVDGVCATGAEEFRMQAWGADVYVTASQKAIGLPPGLALFVASARALRVSEQLEHRPPLVLDYQSWLPIMRAYEERRPSYFATPATNLIVALAVGLQEILDCRFGGQTGMDARFALHTDCGTRMRAAFSSLGLDLLTSKPEVAANTLSALKYPKGVDAGLVKKIGSRGVVVAGGLHPKVKDRYFRVGHMGYSATQPDQLRRTVEAIGGALGECGHTADVSAAVAHFG